MLHSTNFSFGNSCRRIDMSVSQRNHVSTSPTPLTHNLSNLHHGSPHSQQSFHNITNSINKYINKYVNIVGLEINVVGSLWCGSCKVRNCHQPAFLMDATPLELHPFIHTYIQFHLFCICFLLKSLMFPFHATNACGHASKDF